MHPTDEPRAPWYPSAPSRRRRALVVLAIVAVLVVGGALHLTGVLPPS